MIKLRRSWPTACVFVPAVALGLWVSLHYTFAIWGAESDTATPYVLWRGVQRYGIGFLGTFHYTPDNWLLSPLPALFLAFATVSDEPWVVIAAGWAIFVACVLLVFLIVRRAAGTVPAAAAAAVLLLSNRSAIGEMGFLTYPVTHNASLLGGLVALYAVIRWLEATRWRWLALATAALVVAGASDPWTEAAFTLPLGCAAVWRIADAGHAGRQRAAVALAIAIAGTLAVIHTRLFGLLDFVPPTSITFASGADRVHAADMLGRLGAMWFNFLPGRDAAYLWNPGMAEVVANTTLLLLGAGAAAALAVRQLGQRTAFDTLWLAGTASCIVTVAAFVVLDTPKSIQTGRYFMAAYVFGVMLFAASLGRAWDSLPRAARLAAAAYSVLLPIAGLASGPGFWQTASLHMPGRGVPQFAAFLQAHGLHYGYGTYWGTQASAVGWMTRGAVVVRPVAFDPATGRVSPRYGQTSPQWYTQADVPPGQHKAFLAITPGDDGCPDIVACTSAAERQFGPPQGLLQYGDAAILVWDYPLFGADPDILAAHVAPLPVGKPINLTSFGDGAYILGEGWSQPETTGTWTNGMKAIILLRLSPDWAGAAKVTIEARAFVPSRTGSQEVTVSFRGRLLARWDVAPGDYRPYSAVLPADLLRAGSGALEFAIPGAASPRAAGAGTDIRRLGINVQAVRIDEQPA